MDHVQPFKVLIREFFGDLLLFLVQCAVPFDLSEIDWLDKEMLPDQERLDDMVKRRVATSAL